jgi:hypothetical protein
VYEQHELEDESGMPLKREETTVDQILSEGAGQILLHDAAVMA